MIELVRYHTQRDDESCIRVALVKTGRKWLQVVALTGGKGGVRVWKVRKTDARFMTPLMRGNKPYPMGRALKTFRSMARSHGITKGANRILKEAGREQKENKDTAGKAATTSA